MESQQGPSGTSISGRDSWTRRKRRQDFRVGGGQRRQSCSQRRRATSAGRKSFGSCPAATKNATGIVLRANQAGNLHSNFDVNHLPPLINLICRRPRPVSPASWTTSYFLAPEVAAPATTRTRSALRSTSQAPVSVSNISEGVSNLFCTFSPRCLLHVSMPFVSTTYNECFSHVFNGVC